MRIEPFTYDNGTIGSAVEFSLRERAAFNRPPSETQHISEGFTWATSYKGDEVPNRTDAQRRVENFTLDESIRQDARRASRRLVDVFQEVSAIKILPDQLSGRFDVRKAGRLTRELARGEVNMEEIRPFKRTQHAPPKRPTIGIVSGLGNVEYHMDVNYPGKLASLTLSIQWACEAAGLNVVSAITNDIYGSRNIRATLLSDKVGLRDYAVLMNHSMWHWSGVVACINNPELLKKASLLNGGDGQIFRSFEDYNQQMFRSMSGGYGVQYLRSRFDVDLVIGVGSLNDLNKADIQLGGRFQLTDAVETIRKAAKKLGV